MAKRRANGEGNLRKRKDGRWEGRYTAGHDPETGKAIYRNVLGRTQAEARAKLKQAIEEAKIVDQTKAKKYTVGEWMDVWFENYAKVKSMAARLEPMGEFGRNILTRPPEPVKRGKIYEYDQTPADLVLAMAEIQGRAERSLPPPRSAFQSIVQHEPYPVESKAREILSRLRTHGVTRFLLLFRGSRSRSEVVATFLAVLELCRAHILHLAGSETDCTVRQERELPQDLKL